MNPHVNIVYNDFPDDSQYLLLISKVADMLAEHFAVEVQVSVKEVHDGVAGFSFRLPIWSTMYARSLTTYEIEKLLADEHGLRAMVNFIIEYLGGRIDKRHG